MFRRIIIVAAAALFATAAIASEAPAEKREERLDLRALFARAPGVAGGEERISVELVVARVGPDGKLIIGCFNDEAAAQRFLEMPVEKLPTKDAKEK